MENSTRSERAFMVWWHYQITLCEGNFKNETHRNIVIMHEEFWRNEWLKESEPYKDSLMIAAGCVVHDNIRGIYAVKK